MIPSAAEHFLPLIFHVCKAQMAGPQRTATTPGAANFMARMEYTEALQDLFPPFLEHQETA